jgi:ATP-dependent helicase/DNAse subunit B
MPLTLVTGPANSAKARVVLERYRAQIARGPILVVPTAADAAHYRRELAGSGLILGARVEPFGGLMRELAGRAGLEARPLGEVARQRVVAVAVGQAPLELLRPSAAAPGFLAAATRLVAELGARRIEPRRLSAALRAWAPGGRRRAYCEEVAAIYAGYRRRLERLGRVDREQLEAAALDAIRIDPSLWGRTPVLFYGFDDFEPLQLDAVETLARAADVAVSLPYEAGRVALAGRAETFETLRPLADEVVAAAPRAEHYEEDARAALHRLERALFEEDAEPVACGPAVGLLEGATERGELELVAAEIVELLAGGYRAGDVAVVMRSVAGREALIAEVLGERGIPVSVERTLRFGDTAVGRALLGLLRAALADGDAEDLLAWLRAPGLLARPELADRFEATLRRRGVSRAAQARELWDHFPLDVLDRVAAAAGRGPGALLALVAGELERLLAAPVRRRAEVLEGAELEQARVVAAAGAALGELRELTAEDRRLGPSPAELIALLAELERSPPPPGGGVLVCDAPALRARRVRALFVCDVGEGAFPAAGREPPFFSAQERGEIARASGLVLGRFADGLASERYLFYATVTRAESRLRLSWHRAGDDGAPAGASAFVDDVRAAFSPAPQTRGQPSDRDSSEQLRVGGGVPPGDGGVALGPLREAGVLAALAARGAESPSSLEAWTACPVGWFVERLLAAEPLEPEGEPLARGTVAHAVLARVVAELCASGPLAAADAARVRGLVRAVLAEHAGGVSRNPERDRAARRRLEADLERYLGGLAGVEGEHQPEHFELAFGLAGAAHPAVALAGGKLTLRGRIDRVDVDRAAGTAIVHDYKSGEVLGQAKWEERGRLALALYMLAARELLGLEVVGGLYQPLRGADLRPRGALRRDVEPGLAGYQTDRVEAGELEAALAGALERALRAAGELRGGALEPRPATCTPGGVCRHPSICRERAGAR